MTQHIVNGRLKVAKNLFEFINNSVLSHLSLTKDSFWNGFEKLIYDLAPKNKVLLNKRTELQSKINSWHLSQKGLPINQSAYKNFLYEIGYIVSEGPDFSIETANVDTEISQIAGPQLVVPISNSRYALNATNARWGSLYDALYGTDAIEPQDGLATNSGYDPVRGEKVVSWVRDFLDEAVPLNTASHSDVKSYTVSDGNLYVSLENGAAEKLQDPGQFSGFSGDANHPTSIILNNNGLHIEIVLDKDSPIGKRDRAGISDVILESALTTIIDFEDSIAAVDSEDKVACYKNWLGLILGTLSTEFSKNGKRIKRTLNRDKFFLSPNGEDRHLHGRALLLVRNVGHLMTSDAILFDEDQEIPEGILDAVITSMIGMIDFKPGQDIVNSREGSIYIVKPKMHGPEEVAFADTLFLNVEDLLGLQRGTIKMGIMDEERRTTVNLKECIRAAKTRVVFINTGFLDRTGDEIFTSMESGSIVRKNNIKKTSWISAYEDWNVDIGLSCGFKGRAQIGKGMWAMPDMMANMIETKINHPKEGANTAWVPSPTAATLHSTHYHKLNVFNRQKEIENRERANLDDILTIPLSDGANWSAEDIQNELDNNAQGILGYVVRWVNQGIGCSKVPDINNVGLMEDRATLRISSQHIANWLHHGVCGKDQVLETLKHMAKVVDQQNAEDPEYEPMATDLDNSIAFKAACDLVFLGREQPSGYTEPILHSRRREVKMMKNKL